MPFSKPKSEGNCVHADAAQLVAGSSAAFFLSEKGTVYTDCGELALIFHSLIACSM